MPPDAPAIAPPAAPALPVARRGPVLRRARPVADLDALTWHPLRRLFWLAFVGLNGLALSKAHGQSFESVIGAQLILAASMLPSCLWLYGKVRGLPLFPAYALTCTWTFALPLVSENPIVSLFPGWNQLVAALSIVGFLLLGTLAWYAVARKTPNPPAICWTMDEAQSVPVLLVILALCALWTVVYNAGWIRLPTGVDSLSRAISLAMQSLSCFVVSYRLGSGKLSPALTIAFFAALGVLLLAILPSLLLIYAMSIAAVALLAYVVASKRLPWLVCLAMLCIFGFLHLGKSKMRDKYWDEDNPETRSVSPLKYGSFYAEWTQASIEAIREGDESDDASSSLLDRASLMHLLLYFQASTPAAIPYLGGATYAVIPRMIVPRMFDPDKPRSNEASYILAIHYGMQTREDTETTTFAFGLINEAFANFGFIGMAGLAVLLGAFYGKVAQWARQMPILSFRALFAVLVASYSFQSEYSSTFYVAALFQSTVVLLVAGAVSMRPKHRVAAQVSLLD